MPLNKSRNKSLGENENVFFVQTGKQKGDAADTFRWSLSADHECTSVCVCVQQVCVSQHKYIVKTGATESHLPGLGRESRGPGGVR